MDKFILNIVLSPLSKGEAAKPRGIETQYKIFQSLNVVTHSQREKTSPEF